MKEQNSPSPAPSPGEQDVRERPIYPCADCGRMLRDGSKIIAACGRHLDDLPRDDHPVCYPEKPLRDVDTMVEQIVRDVAELPDRTSPADAPDMMLVSADELTAIVHGAIAQSDAQPVGWQLAKEEGKIVGFPNMAGKENIDDALAAELEAAGIEVHRLEFLRDTHPEVKTAVHGGLHGWSFQRAWYYWIAKGPGIELALAERLYEAHPRTVRVEGHCACPSPYEWNKGFATGSYHVDSPAGLKGLADTIRHIATRPRIITPPRPDASAGLVEAAEWREENKRLREHIADIHNRIRHELRDQIEAAIDKAFKAMSGSATLRTLAADRTAP